MKQMINPYPSFRTVNELLNVIWDRDNISTLYEEHFGFLQSFKWTKKASNDNVEVDLDDKLAMIVKCVLQFTSKRRLGEKKERHHKPVDLKMIRCYGCNKRWHIKPDCPLLEEKEKTFITNKGISMLNRSNISWKFYRRSSMFKNGSDTTKNVCFTQVHAIVQVIKWK